MSEQGAPKTFAQTMEELRQEWQKLPAAERAEILKTMYEAYANQFLSHINRIWTTAASFIPLSLGAFAVLISIDHPSFSQILLLSLAGWLLISVWVVIAENHRAFQEGSRQWMREIERIWGFEEVLQPKRVGWLTASGMVRRMRFALWGIVTVGAVLIILFWPGGLLG
jgi:hypothetical protein